MFEKLNQYPFNSKIKKTIFYFPKEKLKTKQILDQNFLSLRRFSEENTPNNKILTSNLFLRSSSKPNILSSNIKEKKINYTTFIKSQRYVNSIRPFTIIKLKEMNKKLTTSLNSLGNEFASSNRYEEDAYQIKEIYNERNKHKGKVWKNLNTIVKSK